MSSQTLNLSCAGLTKRSSLDTYKMENLSVCDENSEDRLNTDIECSTPGAESLDYSRTISEISTYSEQSSSDEPLNLSWPISKLAGRASPLLKKLGMKQHMTKVLDLKSCDDEVSNSGISQVIIRIYSF